MNKNPKILFIALLALILGVAIATLNGAFASEDLVQQRLRAAGQIDFSSPNQVFGEPDDISENDIAYAGENVAISNAEEDFHEPDHSGGETDISSSIARRHSASKKDFQVLLESPFYFAICTYG